MISLIRPLFIAGISLVFPLQIFAAPPPAKELPTAETTPTVIDSDRAEMLMLEEETQFVFTDNVTVTATNLTVRCDRLEAYTSRDEAARGDLDRILAMGNVRIEQEGRFATSGRAEVLLLEGVIVLTENPVLRNEQGSVSGDRITFYRGDSRVVVERGESRRARVVLPNLPDLGADAAERPRENEQPEN